VGWRQIDNLCSIKQLRHLTLHGNPCSKIHGYRKAVVEKLPGLLCLDEFIVLDFERADIGDLYPKESFRGARKAQLKRFKPYNFETSGWKTYGPPVDPNMMTNSEYGLEKLGFCYDANVIEAHLKKEHIDMLRKY
jgi:hypothetical protein